MNKSQVPTIYIGAIPGPKRYGCKAGTGKLFFWLLAEESFINLRHKLLIINTKFKIRLK